MDVRFHAVKVYRGKGALYTDPMPNRCDVLGKTPSKGHTISHSHIRTKRWWRVNSHKRRFWLPSERRWVTLTVSTKGVRTIDKRGIESVVAEMRRAGKKV